MGQHPVLARMKCPLGSGFSSSGDINGRPIICRLWLGSFFPLEMEPDSTVLFPRALERMSALSELGAKPPKRMSWQLSIMMLEPSFP